MPKGQERGIGRPYRDFWRESVLSGILWPIERPPSAGRVRPANQLRHTPPRYPPGEFRKSTVSSNRSSQHAKR